MADYVIGDIHGCYEELQRLLETIEYDRNSDHLWLVGDLVNRGPDSAGVVRWAQSQGNSVTAVLGNHDLRLIALACGACEPRSSDDFGSLADSDLSRGLVDWLAGLPLLHTNDGGRVLVHAALLPRWSLQQAHRLAAEAASLIRGPRRREFLARVFSLPLESAGPRDPFDSTAWAAQVMTRMRICTADGRPCGGFTGPPSEAPRGCRPWFEWPSERPADSRVFFGHWSLLGLRVGDSATGLDTGCVYGGHLTALRLEDDAVFQVRSLR